MDRILEQWARLRPGLDTTPMAVIGRILRASRLLERGLADVFGAFGLNRGQFDVLVALLRSGSPDGLAPTELSDVLLLSTSAMTNRLDRLEGAGLVARAPNRLDRRGLRVRLTPKGHSLITRCVEAHFENEARLLAPLRVPEQAALADLLRKLLTSLEQEPHEGFNVGSTPSPE